MSSPLVLLAVAVVGKIWPDTITSFSTWLYAHVDPRRLPYGSEMNRHWERTHELNEWRDHVDQQLMELQKDGIKNVLIQLINDKTRDNSVEIRYELDKLEGLDAQCWIVDAARQYLIEHATGDAGRMEGK